MRGLRDKENIVYWENLLFPLSVGIYPPIDFLRYAFSTNLVSCCAFQFFFFFKASRNVFNINFSALHGLCLGLKFSEKDFKYVIPILGSKLNENGG